MCLACNIFPCIFFRDIVFSEILLFMNTYHHTRGFMLLGIVIALAVLSILFSVYYFSDFSGPSVIETGINARNEAEQVKDQLNRYGEDAVCLQEEAMRRQ